MIWCKYCDAGVGLSENLKKWPWLRIKIMYNSTPSSIAQRTFYDEIPRILFTDASSWLLSCNIIGLVTRDGMGLWWHGMGCSWENTICVVTNFTFLSSAKQRNRKRSHIQNKVVFRLIRWGSLWQFEIDILGEKLLKRGGRTQIFWTSIYFGVN